MSDIKREEIQKIIDELETRRTGCVRIGDGSDYYKGKADGYNQSISLLESMLDSAPDSPDPGGLY